MDTIQFVLTMTEFWWLISIALVPLSARRRTPGTLNIIITTTTNTNYQISCCAYFIFSHHFLILIGFEALLLLRWQPRPLAPRYLRPLNGRKSDTNLSNRMFKSFMIMQNLICWFNCMAYKAPRGSSEAKEYGSKSSVEEYSAESLLVNRGANLSPSVWKFY